MTCAHPTHDTSPPIYRGPRLRKREIERRDGEMGLESRSYSSETESSPFPGSLSETESPVSISDPDRASFFSPERKPKRKQHRRRRRAALPETVEEAWPRKAGGVMLEGYVDGADGGGDQGSDVVGRTKSLTDEDLEELKGCLDLGFGFSYEEIPELCGTLPALELCYSMSQRYLDEHASGEAVEAAASPPIANWKISSPGDHPEEVKARLKYWAQAVACTVKLCS